MDATDDVVRVEEPECTILQVRNKLDPVEAFSFPPGLMFLVDREPVDPQDVHVGRVSHRVVEYLDPADCQNARIDVWVERVLRERHHVRTAFHIDLVLPSLEIITGIVHGHCVPLLEAVTGDEHLVAVIFRKGWRLLVILKVKYPGKEMVLEVRNEVLRVGQSAVSQGEVALRPAFRAGSFLCSPRAHW